MTTGLLGVLFVVSAAATVLVTSRSVQLDHERDVEAVNDVASRLAGALEAATASLSGADVLGVDGVVTAAEFASFADGIVRAARFTALAFAPIVDDADRRAWELENATLIVDTDGGGGLHPAGSRSRYVPVQFVWPESDIARSVRGFDIAGDPIRRRGVEEAMANDGPVLVGPINLAASGAPGAFVIHDVIDSRGDAAGFIASGIDVAAVLDTIVGDRQPVSVWIDGDPLVDAAASGPRDDIVVGGRSITLQTDDGKGVAWGLPAAGLVGSTVLLAACVLSARRDAADRERERRKRTRSHSLAELADALASADTVDDTMSVGLDLAKAVMGAAHATIAKADPLDPSKLLVADDTAMVHDLAAKYSLQRRDERLPLTDCVNQNRFVCVRNRADLVAMYPNALGEIGAAGLHAVVCHPLTTARGEPIGAAGFAYEHPLSEQEEADLRDAASAAAGLISRALERSLARDAARDHAEQLSVFAASLATAQSPAHVAGAVERELPPLFGVSSVALVTDSAPGDTAARRYALPSAPDGTHLEFGASVAGGWDVATDALARTVVQLTDAAWTRARQHQQEHAVLERLQNTLLAGAPQVRGLDIAVAYRSALDAVGIGGDWYSVVERPDVTYLVVGDVAGHGAEAVAVMAEVKSITRHLLSSGTPIDEALRHAESALARRHSVASMIIVCVEHASPRLTFLNAGHPYPIVKRAGCPATPLVKTHRPLIGIVADTPSPTVHDFDVGDTILLYSDGLVEQRRVDLTESIESLAREIDELADATCEELVSNLVRRRASGRTPAIVDDDVALIAVRRTETTRPRG
jgi:Stage II sporulation protein E (SpoIIE)/CHASE domain